MLSRSACISVANGPFGYFSSTAAIDELNTRANAATANANSAVKTCNPSIALERSSMRLESAASKAVFIDPANFRASSSLSPKASANSFVAFSASSIPNPKARASLALIPNSSDNLFVSCHEFSTATLNFSDS